MFFLYLLYCVLLLWPQVCPLTPKSLAFAARLSKLHHTGAYHVQRKRETEGGKERERDRERNTERVVEEGFGANYGPEKTKGYISMIPPAVLFMSCVLSLSVTFTSTLALSEGKQAKMAWCLIFHFPLFFHYFHFFFFASLGCWKHIGSLIQGSVNFYFSVFHGVALLVPFWQLLHHVWNSIRCKSMKKYGLISGLMERCVSYVTFITLSVIQPPQPHIHAHTHLLQNSFAGSGYQSLGPFDRSNLPKRQDTPSSLQPYWPKQ